MKKRLSVFCFLPFILIYAFPLLIFAFQNDKSKNYIAFFISILIPLAIIRLFKIQPFKFVLISIPVVLLAIIYDSTLFDFQSYINISTWNSIFNTNIGEVTEMNSETRSITKIMMLLHILMFFGYLFYSKGKEFTSLKKSYRIIAFSFLLIIIIDYMFKGATRNAFPVRATESFFGYIDIKKKEAKYFESKKEAIFSAKRDSVVEKKETIVIVLGESLRRDHLEYYGYKKATTPLLKKEDLICFTDVVSPANQSINSVKRIFSLAEFGNERPYWKLPTFIKAYKEVGFKTYWISTQRIYGKHDSEISFIAKETDSITFRQPSRLDFSLVNPYKAILNNKSNKKLIILHLMGNHAKYKRRYPKDFAFFNNTDNEKETLINQYDNSVRYNDYVLSSILEELKKQEGENLFVMFSDHGESLFDTAPNYSGHGSVNPSKSEYNIPFVMWFSNQFKEAKPHLVNEVLCNKDKPIILSDFFHSIPYLYDIKFDKLIKENNFFSKKYVSKTDRKVLNSSLELLEYEKLKKKHDENSN